MKTNYRIALCLLVAVAACSSYQEEQGSMEGAKKVADEVFYATLEQSGGADATKVYADENLKVLWNAGDHITIFNKYTYGYEYAFQGVTGDTAGAFTKEDDDAEFVTGNPLDYIYAVYPYRADNKINNSGDLSITWPSTQTYKADSFGIGANVMVSVTNDNQLRFRNVGGYLALKLYGAKSSVSSITLRGNNGEKLSGRATITCATDTNPELSFQPESQSSLQLNCTVPIPFGRTAESATTFWLVVPPTDFTQGFNITVRTSNGLVFYKSTDIAYKIERNTLCRMAAVEVVPGGIIPFEDANFKAYCVENFDTDSDGEISISEALAVNVINVNTDNIESLQGVEFFNNLDSLSCKGTLNDELGIYDGKLTSLDISNNTCLSYLDCSGNQLTAFDIGNSITLTQLYCNNNQLTTLDVSNCIALSTLYCNNNQLTSLDVSNCSALSTLYCNGNQLTSLNVSDNTALTELICSHNQLTSLNVSNNTALTNLSCSSDPLASLDISHNTALTRLNCCYSQLTSLDVSNNTALTHLACYHNQLTSLDVSVNTALTHLRCDRNQLTSLDVSNNTALVNLYCYGNQLTALDVSNNTALSYLSCSGNPSLTDIWLMAGQIIQLGYDSSVTRINYVGFSDIIVFEDANFKAYCVANFDTNKDGEVSVAEALAVTAINVSTDNIESLQGVEYFENLRWLSCSGTWDSDTQCFNGKLTSLDVSNNTALVYLYCSGNQLRSSRVKRNFRGPNALVLQIYHWGSRMPNAFSACCLSFLVSQECLPL